MNVLNVLRAIEQVKDFLATVRKALVPLVAAAFIVFGPDSWVADAVAILSALGVYAIPNAE